MHTPPSAPLLRRTLLLIAAASAAPRWVWAEAPPLMLPKVYKPGIALHSY